MPTWRTAARARSRPVGPGTAPAVACFAVTTAASNATLSLPPRISVLLELPDRIEQTPFRMRRILPLLLLLAACRPDVPNLDSPGRTIVCLGDSITAGVGSGPGEAYPELLAAKLGTQVINEGISGDTTAGGLARVDDVLAKDPWLVIVEL